MNDYNNENKTMIIGLAGLSHSDKDMIKLSKDKELIIDEVLKDMGYEGLKEYPGCVDKMLDKEDHKEYNEYVNRVNKLSKERGV